MAPLPPLNTPLNNSDGSNGVIQRAAVTACRIGATSTRRCTRRLDTVDTVQTAGRTLMDLTVTAARTSSTVEVRQIDVSTAPATQSASTANILSIVCLTADIERFWCYQTLCCPQRFCTWRLG